MSENQDEKLAVMLRYRPLKPASLGLAQRIILKAQSVPQLRKSQFGKRIAYSFASKLSNRRE
jgi:hypothetical protein